MDEEEEEEEEKEVVIYKYKHGFSIYTPGLTVRALCSRLHLNLIYYGNQKISAFYTFCAGLRFGLCFEHLHFHDFV
jgi:hypothetical protein